MGPFAFSHPMLRSVLQASCKEVEWATALSTGKEDVRVNTQDRAFTGLSVYYIDSSFFKVFSYTSEAGLIPVQGLAPDETIVSEDYARKFFGKENPVGKTLLVGKEMKPYRVAAVLHEGFEKSHLEPKLFLPRRPDPSETSANWASCSYYNYVKLQPQASPAALRGWLDRFREKIVYPSTGTEMPYKEWKEASNTISFVVQPLTDIYFDNSLKFDLSPGGNLP